MSRNVRAFRKNNRAPPAPINQPTEPKHSLISKLNGSANLQDNCALFVCIPAEIRNKIFSLALYSYDDLSRPYPEHAYYYRPGYHYRQRIDTSLLETCRRIYSETHDLPISQNEHVFWFSASRGPTPSCDNPRGHFSRFTEEQKEAVVRVHFFTQLYWLEGKSFTYAFQVLNDLNVHVKKFKITIPHTDWWNWESNTPLVMKSEWAHDNFGLIKGLETLEVELETMERDKNQLERIVKKMLSWRLNLSPLRAMTTEGFPPENEKYMGQAAFSGTSHQSSCIYYVPQNNRWTFARMPVPSDVQTQLSYVVSILRWNVIAKSEEDL